MRACPCQIAEGCPGVWSALCTRCVQDAVDKVCGEPSWHMPDLQGYLMSSGSQYLERSGREGWGGSIAANMAFCDKKLRLKQGCSKSTGDRCQETRQLRPGLLPPPSAGILGFFSSFWSGNYNPCQWAKALALISSGQPCLKFCHRPEILRAIETPQLCLLLSRAAKSLSR